MSNVYTIFRTCKRCGDEFWSPDVGLGLCHDCLDDRRSDMGTCRACGNESGEEQYCSPCEAEIERDLAEVPDRQKTGEILRTVFEAHGYDTASPNFLASSANFLHTLEELGLFSK